MHAPPAKSRSRLASRLLAAGLAIAAADRARAVEGLSGAMLRDQLPGAQINLDTPLGSVIPITFGADGTLEGRAGAVAFFLGAQQDRGKWWVEGSKLCQQWNTWFDGRKNCVQVFRTHGNRIEYIDKDGDKGTGTIVSLAPAAKVAEVPGASAPPPEVRSPEIRKPPAAAPAAAIPPAPTLPKSVTRTARAAAPPPKPPLPERKALAQPPGKKNEVSVAAITPAPEETMRTAAGPRFYRVVNVPSYDVLNVRAGPSATNDILATIPPGARGVIVIGACREDWCRIRRGRDTGWVHSYFLAPEYGARDDRKAAEPITYRVVRVASDDVLNIRQRPDAEAAIVGSIPASGRRVRLTGYCAGEWCPVSFERYTGWVNRYYLTLEF